MGSLAPNFDCLDIIIISGKTVSKRVLIPRCRPTPLAHRPIFSSEVHRVVGRSNGPLLHALRGI